MKKTMVWLCSTLLLLSLGGCGKKEPTPDGSDGGSEPAQRTLGMGAVSTNTMHGTDRTRVKTTVAAVILDTRGRIVECAIDELDFMVTLTDGVAAEVPDLTTKGEKGDRYQPTTEDVGESGDTATPWHEQVEEFCDFLEGKTGAEVSALAATDGKSPQIDGCDLILTDFILAVRKAADNAAPHKIGAGDDLRLAVSAAKSETATDQKPQYDVEMAAVTLDSGDRITGCVTDSLQAKLTIADRAFTTVSGGIDTKRDKGDAYGMKSASGIQREWYEQADAFGVYARGKTGAELARLALGDDGKTDAIAGCTIDVSRMLRNTVKAASED